MKLNLKRICKKITLVLTATALIFTSSMAVFADANSTFYVDGFGTVKCRNYITNSGYTACAYMSVVGEASLNIYAHAKSGDLGYYTFSASADSDSELLAQKYVVYGVTGVWARYSVDDGNVSGSGTLDYDE